MKYISISFDWERLKDMSWDNYWKTIVESTWNNGMPFLSGVFVIIYQNPLFLLIYLIPAIFELKIERNPNIMTKTP